MLTLKVGHYALVVLVTVTPVFAIAQYSPNRFITPANSKLSSEDVRAVLQDDKGYLWVGTADGLNKYDGYTFEVFKHLHEDTASIADNDINSLAMDHRGKIWAGSANGLISRYNPYTHNFSSIGGVRQGLPEDVITKIYFDQHDRMWVGVKRHGLYYYEEEHQLFIKAGDLPDIHPGYQVNPNHYNNYNSIYDIYEDAKGDFWLATHDGLYQYQPVTNLFKAVRQTKVIPFEDRYDLFRKILPTPDGLWLSSWGGGLTFFNLKTQEWKNYKMTTGSSGTNNILEDMAWKQDDQLWVASRDFGFGYFDIKKEKFTFLYETPSILIFSDRGKMIWVGTEDEGFLQFDPSTLFYPKHVNVTRSDNGDHYFINGFFHDLTSHQLFFGVAYGDGLHVYDELTQKETVHTFDVLPKSEQVLYVSSIYPDKRDSLWILTSDFIYLFDRKSRSMKKFHQPFDPVTNLKTVITPDYYRMLRTANGDLWFTTLNQGVYRYRFDEKSFIHYNQTSSSLLSNSAKAIEEDPFGRVWIITGNQLTLFSYQDNRFHGL